MLSIRIDQRISRSIGTILAGKPVGADVTRDVSLADVLLDLERFIPENLKDGHQEWRNEGLDGVLPLLALKTGEREIDLVGHCVLISDQSIAPLRVRVRVSRLATGIEWFECKLGQRGERGMIRRPYGEYPASKQLLGAIRGGTEQIDWAYGVEFVANVLEG